GIVAENIAEPLALRTGAKWMVKGKENGTNRFECPPTLLAAKGRTVSPWPLVDDFHAAEALALAKCGFDCFDEAGPVVLSDHQPVKDHSEMVRPGFGKGVDLMEIEDFFAALDSCESAQQQRLEKGLVLFRRRCCNREEDHLSRVVS